MPGPARELGLEDWSVLYFQQALTILLLKKCFLSQRRFITHRGSCFDRGRFTDQNPEIDDAYEFIISTEKKTAYPKTLINFQKPGTGVWSIDLLKSKNGLEAFDLGSMHTIARSEKGSTLHYKDPVGI